jgi:DNA-binding MarR family transcriptional regulator
MKDPSDVSPLKAHLGYWLRFVSNHVSHAFSRKVLSQGVTVAEWVVLRELFDQDAMAPSGLAARLGLTRGAVSKLIDRLADKALVHKAAGEGDRRYLSVGLTKKGHALVPKLAALADQNDDEFFGDLSPAERKKLSSVMQRIVQGRGLTQVPTS